VIAPRERSLSREDETVGQVLRVPNDRVGAYTRIREIGRRRKRRDYADRLACPLPAWISESRMKNRAQAGGGRCAARLVSSRKFNRANEIEYADARAAGEEIRRYHAGSFVDDERQLFAFLLFSFLPPRRCESSPRLGLEDMSLLDASREIDSGISLIPFPISSLFDVLQNCRRDYGIPYDSEFNWL